MNSKPKILIVDDDSAYLKLLELTLLLQNPNYKIRKASNTPKAYNLAIVEIPDLIISDWNMPGKSGIDLIFELKSNPATKNIPVIISTGLMISSKNLKTALDAGAMDFITKPINKFEIEARVNSALKLSLNHKEMIRLKNNEIHENSLYLVKTNEFLKNIPHKLDQLKCPEECNKQILESIKDDINLFLRSDLWERFDTSLNSLYSNFHKNLLEQFPDLTTKELKLCALLLMGMSIKDMASLLNQKSDSIKVARYRIRKKLNLTDKENLQTFLISI